MEFDIVSIWHFWTVLDTVDEYFCLLAFSFDITRFDGAGRAAPALEKPAKNMLRSLKAQHIFLQEMKGEQGGGEMRN